MLKRLSFEEKGFIIVDNNDSKTLELKDEQIKAKDHIELEYLEPLKELKKKCAIAKAMNANNELQIKFYFNSIEEKEKVNLSRLFNQFLKNHIVLNDLEVCNPRNLLSIFYEVNTSVKSQTFYSICGLPILEILAQSYLSRYMEIFFNISNIQKEIEAALYYKSHCEMLKEPLKVNIYGMSIAELELLKRKFFHQLHFESIENKEGFLVIIKQDNTSYLELHFTSKKVANLEEEISISGKIPNVNQEICANELKILIPSKKLSRFLLLDKLLDEEKLKTQRNGADWIYLIDRYCQDEISLQNRYMEKHFRNNFSSCNDYLEIENSLTNYLKTNYQKEEEKRAFVLFHSLVFLNEMGWDKFMLERIWEYKLNDLQNRQIKNASFKIAVENGILPSFIGFYGFLQAIILVRSFFDESISFNINEGRLYIRCEGFLLEFDKKKSLRSLLHALSDTVTDEVLLALIETHILSIKQQRSAREKQILFNHFFEDGFDDFKEMILTCLNEENPSKNLLGAFICSLLVDIIPQAVSDIRQKISLWQLSSALCRICHSERGMRIFQWLHFFYLEEKADFFTCILEEETNSKRCVAWMQEAMKKHVKSKEARHYWVKHLVDIESSEIDSYIKNAITYFHCLEPMERLLWLPIWRNVLLQRRDISAQEIYRLLLVLQSCKDNTQLGKEVFFDLQTKILSLEVFSNHLEPIFFKKHFSSEGLDQFIQELIENQNLAEAYNLIIFCMINNIKCDEKVFLQHLLILDNDQLSQLIVKMKKTVDGIAEKVNYQSFIYQFFFDILDCLAHRHHYGAVNFGESLQKAMRKTNLIEKWIYTFSKFECSFTDWKEAKSDVLLKGHHQVFKFCLDFLQKREFAIAFLYFDRLINYLKEKIKVECRTALPPKEPEEVEENAAYPWEEDPELEQDLTILECEMTCNLTSILEVVFDSNVKNLRKKLSIEEQEIKQYSTLFFGELLSIHDCAADDVFNYCITVLKQLESCSSKNLRALTCQLQTQYLAEIAIRGSKKTLKKGIILGINWVKNEKDLELWVQLINCIAVLAPLTAAKEDRNFKTSVQRFLNEHSFEVFKALITNYEVLAVFHKKLETKEFELKVISNDNDKSLLSSAKQSFAALIAIEQYMIAKWLYEKTIEPHLEHCNDEEKNQLLSLLCQQAGDALQNDDLAAASSILLSGLNYWPGIAVSEDNKKAINAVIGICLHAAKKQSQMIQMMPVFLKIDKALFINTYDDDIVWFIKHTHKTKKWEECSKFLEMKNIDFEEPKKELQKIVADCLLNNINTMSIKGNQIEKEALIVRLIKIAIDYKIKEAAVLESFVNVLFRYDNDSLKCLLLNYLSSLLLQETKDNFYLIFAKLHWSLSILEMKDEKMNVDVLMRMYSENLGRFTMAEVFLFLSYMAPAIMRIKDEKTFVNFFLLSKKCKEKYTYIPTEETYNKIDRYLVEGYLKRFSIAKENGLFPPFLGYSYIQKVEMALKIKENTLSFFKTIIHPSHSSNEYIIILIALIFRELIENKNFKDFPEYIDLLMTKTEVEDRPPLEDMALLAFIYLVEDKEWGVKQIKNMHKNQTDNLEQLIIKASEKTELKVSYNDDKKNTFPIHLLLNEQFNFLFKTEKMLLARGKLYNKFISKIEEKFFSKKEDISNLSSNKLEESMHFLLFIYVNCLEYKKRNLDIFKNEDEDFRQLFTKINKNININICISKCLFAILEKASFNNVSQTKNLFPIALENMIYCHKPSTNEDIEQMYKYISYVSNNTFSARLIHFFDKNILHIMRSKNFECLTKLIIYLFDKSSVRDLKKYEVEKNKKRVISTLSIIIKDREFNEFDCLEKFFKKILKLNHLDVFGRMLDIFFYYDSLYTLQQREELLKLLITTWKNLLFSMKKEGYTINMLSYLQRLLFDSKYNIDFIVSEIMNVISEYRRHENFDLLFLNYIFISMKEKIEAVNNPNPFIFHLLNKIENH